MAEVGAKSAWGVMQAIMCSYTSDGTTLRRGKGVHGS